VKIWCFLKLYPLVAFSRHCEGLTEVLVRKTAKPGWDISQDLNYYCAYLHGISDAITSTITTEMVTRGIKSQAVGTMTTSS
jgi:hypothetical protein